MKRRSVACILTAWAALAGCKNSEPEGQRYYDQHIQPIFNQFCVGATSPCHQNQGQGIALGNLDLTSFDNVKKRSDALRTYGSYPLPLLLLKAVPEASVLIPYKGTLQVNEIRHAGGKPIAQSSDAFFELKRWLDAGATRDGLPPPDQGKQGQGPCATQVPADIDLSHVDRQGAAYQQFVANVQPLLASSCAFSTCHGAPLSDFYMTCGSDDRQRDFNFLQAASFIIDAPTNVEQSELLLRPLSPRAGGASHTGGAFFEQRENETWQKLKAFGVAVQTSPPAFGPIGMGQQFFEANVMPMLIRRGCSLETCHSPNGFNDYRLRPGAQGFLSRLALKRNYETTLTEFMSLDSVDVRQSRLVKKGIFGADGGMTHRAGAVLETPGQNISTPCPAVFDSMTTNAYCIVAEWHRLERQERAADVSPMASGDVLPVAFVSRPANADTLLEFDTFRGEATLELADAVVGGSGRIERLDNRREAPCTALAGRTDVDIRGPEWSPDGSKLVFAARQGASGGLDLWLFEPGSGNCRQLTNDNGRMQGDVKVHNFDPTFTPVGGVVFASTRTGTRTLKRLLPNADLFRVDANLDFSAPEQMTHLLGSELSPAFMQDGRMLFTAEKATRTFYQLSGRRINWDLTDYHPLLAQRARSDDTFGQTFDSVGFGQATEIREGIDRNFILVLSNDGAKGGGGVLATFNRSIGPFERGREEVTFLKSVIFYGGPGVYRSPYSLPDGSLLASYADSADLPRYDLVAADSPGSRRVLLAGGSRSLVEASVGYKRSSRHLFRNTPQLVFGGHGGTNEPTATMHFPDLPLLATLLDFNLRRGRNVTRFDSTARLRVYEELPPPPGTTLPSGETYEMRRLLGSAPLAADHSLKVTLPSRKPLILELVDGQGNSLFTMREEHQLGPGEQITPGVSRSTFNGVCGGCHGSISGSELDVAVTADALTGASVSLSRDQSPKSLE